MQTFRLSKEPKCVAQIIISDEERCDFGCTYKVVKVFLEQHPELKGLEYSSKFLAESNEWLIRFFDGSAYTFVEE